MMLHQDGSTHQWVSGTHWDLIITLDDATSEHYSMLFIEEEGTASSFQGMVEVIERWGLPSSLYTDRGSHYWTTPEAGGKVDRAHPTQFGRAMRQLGVEMIPAYSPEARGRCERMFATHQERLPKELAAHGITTMAEANRYLAEHYRAVFNEEFAVPAAEPGSAFVPFIGPGLADILCEHRERTVEIGPGAALVAMRALVDDHGGGLGGEQRQHLLVRVGERLPVSTNRPSKRRCSSTDWPCSPGCP